MRRCLAAFLFLLCSWRAQAENVFSHPNWWCNAVIYEVYPRSFSDSDGDGIGDLNGVTAHLDYLKELGIDAIWIAPFFPSPQADFGYDISDYRAVDPQFGTMADFERLVSEAKKRGIGIVGDMVLNHTSDQHPWFIESSSSRTNPKADWYLWSSGKNRQLPNNWLSVFGGSAWEFGPARQQFYYHRFYKQQPDLNWRNPQVRNAMYDVCRFWLRKGMIGLRLDAIMSLFENEQLKDEPYTGGVNESGNRVVKTIYTENDPGTHEVLRELRTLSGQFPGSVLIGETYVDTLADLRNLYGAKQDELQLPMHMKFGSVNQLSASAFRNLLNDAEHNLGANNTPLFVLESHDESRSLNRYGDGTHDPALAKLLATLLLTPRDSALLYYGEEIGMIDHVPTTVDQVRDPSAKKSWLQEKRRFAARTPMQWSDSPQSGFSNTPKTWLPVGGDYTTVNVSAQRKDPHSVLNYYKKLIELKKTNQQLKEGDFTSIDNTNSSVLSFLRKTKDGRTVAVSLNMTKQEQTVDLNLKQTHGRTLLASFEVADTRVDLHHVSLPSYGAILVQVNE